MALIFLFPPPFCLLQTGVLQTSWGIPGVSVHEVLRAGWGELAGTCHVLVTQPLWFSVWFLLYWELRGWGETRVLLQITMSLCRGTLTSWCSAVKFLDPLLFIVTASAAFCSHPQRSCGSSHARPRFM